LLWLCLGFTVGTLFCGLARSYEGLVAARFFAGAFGGVVGAVILAIVGDVIPMERRGAAMGTVMTSFSLASIIGVPLGIYVAATFSWHVPFIALAVLSAVVTAAAGWIIPPLRGHLEHARDEHPIVRTWAVLTHPDHQKAFLFMAVLTCAGFVVFPFVPAFMRYNIGFTEKELIWIYLCGGLCTFFSMNWIGRWADRVGKLHVFRIVSLSTAVPILLVTNLHRVPLAVAILTTTLLFICMSGRMVPAMAMMTGVVEARYRGGFMSVNSAVQQLAMGAASLLSGEIVREGADHALTRFSINGLVAITCAYSCIYLARFLKPAPEEANAPEPVVMETV
jgi:predicted MFS family arabinose efflux permease